MKAATPINDTKRQPATWTNLGLADLGRLVQAAALQVVGEELATRAHESIDGTHLPAACCDGTDAEVAP